VFLKLPGGINVVGTGILGGVVVAITAIGASGGEGSIGSSFIPFSMLAIMPSTILIDVPDVVSIAGEGYPIFAVPERTFVCLIMSMFLGWYIVYIDYPMLDESACLCAFHYVV